MPNDATLTGKRQTTIPEEIRRRLGTEAGARMTFTLMPDGTGVKRVKGKSIEALAGILVKKGRKTVPIELLARCCWASIPISSFAT